MNKRIAKKIARGLKKPSLKKEIRASIKRSQNESTEKSKSVQKSNGKYAFLFDDDSNLEKPAETLLDKIGNGITALSDIAIPRMPDHRLSEFYESDYMRLAMTKDYNKLIKHKKS